MANAFLQNLGSSLTGNIPKAILLVRKPDVTGEPLGNTKGDKKKMCENLMKMANGKSGLTSSSPGVVFKQENKYGDNYVALEVQYNPESVNITTRHGDEKIGYSGGTLGDKSNNLLLSRKYNKQSELNVDLVFDDCNPAFAFVKQDLNFNVDDAVDLVQGIANRKGYSVQKYCDAFMGMMSQLGSRDVVFFWSKMCFPGLLMAVDVNYTMFNNKGAPIRATVSLNIRQFTTDNQFTSNYWMNAYNKAFPEDGSLGNAQNFLESSQLSNLLNI